MSTDTALGFHLVYGCPRPRVSQPIDAASPPPRSPRQLSGAPGPKDRRRRELMATDSAETEDERAGRTTIDRLATLSGVVKPVDDR
jgi:hypothetical protein